VDVRNSGAIALYRKLKFAESGRLPSYYGRGLDAFEMSRNIVD
jgi:ribosomal protein S18 acetylase RimI-like enzyme